MTLDDLTTHAHDNGYTTNDVEQARQILISDKPYWSERGPEALLSAVRRLREGLFPTDEELDT